MARAHQLYMGGKSFCRITRTAKTCESPHPPQICMRTHKCTHLAYILLEITTKLIITISRISAFMRAHTNLGRERWVQASRVFSLQLFCPQRAQESFDVSLAVDTPDTIADTPIRIRYCSILRHHHGTPPWHLIHVHLFPPTQQLKTDYDTAISAIFAIFTISACNIRNIRNIRDFCPVHLLT